MTAAGRTAADRSKQHSDGASSCIVARGGRDTMLVLRTGNRVAIAGASGAKRDRPARCVLQHRRWVTVGRRAPRQGGSAGGGVVPVRAQTWLSWP
jgi:hypothetical protein